MAYYMEELGVDLDLVGGDRVAWLARIRQLEDRVQRLETEAGRVGEITSDGVPWFCRSEETGGGGGTQAAGPATALVHSLPLARGLEAAEPTDGGGGVMIVPGSPLPAAGYGRPLVMDRRGAPKPPSPDWTDVAGGMQIRDIQDIIRPVISRNGYWAHPEQLLLVMIADEDREIRTAAIQHIRAAREREKEGQEVRKFTLPTINFGAQRYVDLIDSAAEKVTEPPLLRDLSVTELQGIAAAPLRVSAYPVHTQAVERAVRDVTEASLRVVGEEARHGRITACIKHRKSVPKFNSKRDVQI
ncbi:hypothetical protein FJT64_024788 [Amphibalanus amphitrite]|uniref:Uncharacterized protein n=1 Tax=Amphibalanus amphitrite TaxID=1232801 RepID=A0A6A4WMP3_AMPAM|nr:hypothetical protein FJT64_024788 [Amphibalanus amphitrite]